MLFTEKNTSSYENEYNILLNQGNFFIVMFKGLTLRLPFFLLFHFLQVLETFVKFFTFLRITVTVLLFLYFLFFINCVVTELVKDFNYYLSLGVQVLRVSRETSYFYKMFSCGNVKYKFQVFQYLIPFSNYPRYPSFGRMDTSLFLFLTKL